MADLTTVDDIEAAIGRPPADATEEARWGYYISSISEFINGYVDDSFEELVDDVVRLQADYYGILFLPGGPINGVTLVADWNTGQQVASYYNGLDNITGLKPLAVVDVTYSHGWPSVPLDIQYLVTDAIVSVLQLSTTGTGALKSLTVGGTSETYADGTGAVVVKLRKGTLDKYVQMHTTYRLGGTPGFSSVNDLPLL